MSNIEQCPICKRYLIAEEVFDHRCGCKIIDLNYRWWVNSEIKGMGEVLIIEDEFGTVYRIKPRQPKGNTSGKTDNVTEPFI